MTASVVAVFLGWIFPGLTTALASDGPAILIAPLVPATVPATTSSTTPAKIDPAPRREMNPRVFDRVWNEVRRSYYDPHLHGLDWDQIRATYRPQALAAGNEVELYAVLDRMLRLLDDSHARALSPSAVRRQALTRTRRPVLGVTLYASGDDEYRIERVRPGSPAASAGVQVGWRLDRVQNGWSLDSELVDGQPVSLDFRDPADGVHRVSITPRFMDPTPLFAADTSHPGVVVLRVEGFEPGLGDWMGARLAEAGPDAGVVMDLRANPGGRLSEADAVLSCFLPSRSDWAVRTSRSGRATTLRIQPGCGDLRLPATNRLAVLIDGASRSAAELTPAALQEAGRAVVVGEKTPGAVLISRDTPLPDGGRLTLSRADFVTSRGVRLEKRGVTPDLAVQPTADDRGAGRDPALDAAIALLRAGLSATPEAPTGGASPL